MIDSSPAPAADHQLCALRPGGRPRDCFSRPVRQHAPPNVVDTNHASDEVGASLAERLAIAEGAVVGPTFRDALGTDYVTDAVLSSAKTGQWTKVKQA